MTRLERTLLNAVQHDFPLEPRPFFSLAQRYGITEKKCLTTLKRLSEKGVLRAIRPVFSWDRLGFATVLIGMHIRPKHLSVVARAVNRSHGVTHNYARAGRLNLWFTLIYRDRTELKLFLDKLRLLPGVVDIKEFHAEKAYKIRLILDF